MQGGQQAAARPAGRKRAPKATPVANTNNVPKKKRKNSSSEESEEEVGDEEG